MVKILHPDTLCTPLPSAALSAVIQNDKCCAKKNENGPLFAQQFQGIMAFFSYRFCCF